jgi:hypothetical protein
MVNKLCICWSEKLWYYRNARCYNKNKKILGNVSYSQIFQISILLRFVPHKTTMWANFVMRSTELVIFWRRSAWTQESRDTVLHNGKQGVIFMFIPFCTSHINCSWQRNSHSHTHKHTHTHTQTDAIKQDFVGLILLHAVYTTQLQKWNKLYNCKWYFDTGILQRKWI